MHQSTGLNLLMNEALKEAQKAYKAREVPVGAIVADLSNNVIVRTHNHMRRDKDPTAHAELLAIRMAAKKTGQTHLNNLQLIVTLEPCIMCAAAISHGHIARLVYGSYDIKAGAVDNGVRVFEQQNHWKPEVISGYMEMKCQALMKNFFMELRL